MPTRSEDPLEHVRIGGRPLALQSCDSGWCIYARRPHGAAYLQPDLSWGSFHSRREFITKDSAIAFAIAHADPPEAEGGTASSYDSFVIERIVDGKVDAYRVHGTGVDCFVADMPTGGKRIFPFFDGWVREDGKAAHFDWKPPFVCKARAAGTAGGNDPSDCSWPGCGCDPHADKVIAALDESGQLKPAQAECDLPTNKTVLSDNLPESGGCPVDKPTCYGANGLDGLPASTALPAVQASDGRELPHFDAHKQIDPILRRHTSLEWDTRFKIIEEISFAVAWCGGWRKAAEGESEELARLRRENERLRTRLLTAAGDDLCRLTPEEIKAYSSGAVKIPPKSEFIPSCERFHSQIANESGVMTNCLTLAQLVAENEKQRIELESIREELAHMRTTDAIQDLAAANLRIATLESDLEHARCYLTAETKLREAEEVKVAQLEAELAKGREVIRGGLDVILPNGAYAVWAGAWSGHLQIVDGVRQGGETTVDEFYYRLPDNLSPAPATSEAGEKRKRLEKLKSNVLSPAWQTGYTKDAIAELCDILISQSSARESK